MKYKKHNDGLSARERYDLKNPPFMVRIPSETKICLMKLAKKKNMSAAKYAAEILDNHLIANGIIKINRIMMEI